MSSKLVAGHGATTDSVLDLSQIVDYFWWKPPADGQVIHREMLTTGAFKPSGKERGLTDLKCSFLLHFGAQSLFFKNAKQCFYITGKRHVSVSNVMPRLPISFHEAGDVQRKTMSLSEHCSTGVWHDFWVFQYGKQFKITCLTCSKRPREKRVTEAVSLEFTSLVSPVMYFLAYAIVKNRNHKWNKILTWLKINKTSFVCSQSDRFKRCARSL